MASLHIHASDIPDFHILAGNKLTNNRVTNIPTLHETRFHERIGMFHIHHTQLPGIHLLNMKCKPVDDVILHDTANSEIININCFLNGYMFSDFADLKAPLEMKPGKYNMICLPNEKNSHRIRRNELVEMFHISIEKAFFMQLLHPADHWSEQAYNTLQKGAPFIGAGGLPRLTPRMMQLVHSMRHSHQHGSTGMLFLQSQLYELLALQFNEMKHPVEKETGLLPNDVEKLFFVRQYIGQHYLEEMTLDSLARLSLLNEFKLKSGFKQLFDTSVIGYVRKLRMEHAGRLLRDEKKLVEEVACLLGYEYAHHFSTAFKKYYGVTPSQWSAQ